MSIRALRCGFAVVIVVTLSLAASSAFAQAAAPPAPTMKPTVTVNLATDFTNAYMFRGIRQDDTKVITWPYGDLLLGWKPTGAIKSVTFDFGTWNSLHPGAAGSEGPSGKLWYERDWFTTAAVGFTGGTVGATYTAYTSPNSGFTTVKELAVKYAVDDSAAGRAAMAPYALVAFEMDTSPQVGQADAGMKAGRYLELGVTPTAFSSGKVTLTVPVKVGLSLGGYYETNEGTAALPDYVDHKFGYLSTSGVVTVPLGAGVNVHGGIEVQTYGETTKAFNNGDRAKVIGLIGVGVGLSH